MIAPKVIPNVFEKHVYLDKHQKNRCPIAKEKINPKHWSVYLPSQLHHAGVHNTKVNRQKYPLFIHSLFNLKLVNPNLHMQFGSWGKISYREADKRERFLERHPAICKFVNMEK